MYGLVKVSVIPFRSLDDRLYRYIGVNFTFRMLDCDRYIGDIVIPWIVKPGFCFIHHTVTLAAMKNVNRYIGNIVLSKIVEWPINNDDTDDDADDAAAAAAADDDDDDADVNDDDGADADADDDANDDDDADDDDDDADADDDANGFKLLGF